uniref:Ragulator complex protein LAMTOR1 n=1 Tax=Sus scrofa TaxID=9823 RepID=A0A8D1FGD5_PIG
MGCCYSSENEDSDQDREERKLLLDPSSPPTKALNGAEPNYHSLPSARTDEQALLSSILAKTARWASQDQAWAEPGPAQPWGHVPSASSPPKQHHRRVCRRLPGHGAARVHGPGEAVQHPPGRAEQQPDPLEEAAAAAVPHQPAPPSAGQRAHPLLRLAAGLQDSCLCLQCTFSDPRGRKRGAGCTVWDPVKRGPPPCRCTALLSSPRLHPASPAPSLTAAYTEP